MEDSYLGIYIMNQGPITLQPTLNCWNISMHRLFPPLHAVLLLKCWNRVGLELLQHCLLTFSVAASSIGGHLLLKDIVFYKQFSQ